jgi:large-conductance mechanosensitive channel
MTDGMLEGLGILNQWHRYKILDAIKVMKIEAEKVRQANKARLARDMLHLKRNNRKTDPLDLNADGNVDMSDFFFAANSLHSSFWGFIVNKEVSALVVGVALAGRLSILANTFAEGIIEPLFIGTWNDGRWENEFHVLQYGAGRNASNPYKSLKEALADEDAVIIRWGLFFMQFVEFLCLGVVLYVLFKGLKFAKRYAKAQYLKKDDSFHAWEQQNGGGGKLIVAT